VWIFKGEVFEKPKVEAVVEPEAAQAAAAAVPATPPPPPAVAAEPVSA